MIALSTPCVLALAATVGPPATIPQSPDVPDPARAALVAHLVDRTSRELSTMLADWRVATGAAKAALEAEVAALAVERRAYLAESMVRTPRAAWTAVLDDTDRADVDMIAPGNTAQPLAAVGTLDAACLETEPEVGSGLSYSLEDGLGMRWRLRAGGGALDREQVGAVVEIEGFAIDGELVLDDGSVTTLVPAAPTVPVIGPYKYQVVVANVQKLNGEFYPSYNSEIGASGQPVVKEFMELNSMNVTHYYDEASFEQLQLLFDYAEHTVTVTDLCDQVEIRDAVIAELEQIPGGWTQDNYHGIAIFVPWAPEGGTNQCPDEANAATVGSQRFTLLINGAVQEYDLAYTWLPVDLTKPPTTDRLHTLLHEFGHTLGCNHASTWTADVLASPGSYCDYGDPFSPMNSKYTIQKKCPSLMNGLAHHNAYHKLESLGWIDPAMVEEVNLLDPFTTTQFQLYPTAYNTVGASSTNNKRQILKIARGDLGAVWVEYRREIPGSLYETKARYINVLPAGTQLQTEGAAFLYVEPVEHRSAMLDPRKTIPNTYPSLVGWCLTHLTTGSAQTGGIPTVSSYVDDCSNTTVRVLGITPVAFGPPRRLIVEVQTDENSCLDVEGPKLAMTTPAGGTEVAGTIQLRAEAWDYETGGSVIDQVEFYHTLGAEIPTPLPGAPTLTLSGQVYTASLSVDTHAFPNGSNYFSARAKDDPDGCCPNTGSSPLLKLTVLNPFVLPGITLAAPPQGATVSVPFTVETNPTPAGGIASVEYFFDPGYADPCDAGELHNGAHPAGCAYHAFFPAFSEHFPSLGGRSAFLLGTGDGSQPDLLVSSLPPGNYTWWARAISNSGATVLSELRTLTVTGSGPFAVQIPLTEGATVMGGATVSIPATVTADPGEAGYVDFFVDGAFLARDATEPFTAPWTAPSGTASHVLRADAFGIGGRTATDDVTVQVP